MLIIDTLAVISSMKIRLLVLGLLTIVCCSTRPDTQTVDKKSGKIAEEQESILYRKEVLHNFSSTVDKDTFKIYVTGQSIKDGQITFQIIKKDGIVIMDQIFPTYQFLDYGLKDNSTEKEEEYIKCKIDKLLDEDNFHQPAIAANDIFDEDYTKKEIWDDIISDQSTIGFYYKIGEEDMRFIAYSKRQMKIVIYYNCC